MKAVTSFAMITCDVTSFATSCSADKGLCQPHAHKHSCCSQAAPHSALRTAHALLCRSAAAVCQRQTYPELFPHLLDEGMCQHSQGALSCCSAALHSTKTWGQAFAPCGLLLRGQCIAAEHHTVLEADVLTPARVGGMLPATDRAPRAPVVGLVISVQQACFVCSQCCC